MEENEIIEEQPEISGSLKEQAMKKIEESEAEKSVSLGKFKNVEDLYQSYTNLQSEFTKKCQRLSELEKDKIDTTQMREDMLESEFKSFLIENQEAYSYADEIKSKVLSDENLKNAEKPFDTVWKSMLYEKLTSKNKTKEPIVRDFILNDEELKNLVIENYVKDISKNKVPNLISSSSGENVTKIAMRKPDTFEQAKNIVLDLLS